MFSWHYDLCHLLVWLLNQLPRPALVFLVVRGRGCVCTNRGERLAISPWNNSSSPPHPKWSLYLKSFYYSSQKRQTYLVGDVFDERDICQLHQGHDPVAFRLRYNVPVGKGCFRVWVTKVFTKLVQVLLNFATEVKKKFSDTLESVFLIKSAILFSFNHNCWSLRWFSGW